MISSALVLQERKLNVRKKFRRMRLQRKEGEKKKGAEKEMLERDDDKEKEKRKKRRGSSLRPDLAEYKVLAKARREKSKLVIGAKTCNHEGQSCKMSKLIQRQSTDIGFNPLLKVFHSLFFSKVFYTDIFARLKTFCNSDY